MPNTLSPINDPSQRSFVTQWEIHTLSDLQLEMLLRTAQRICKIKGEECVLRVLTGQVYADVWRWEPCNHLTTSCTTRHMALSAIYVIALGKADCDSLSLCCNSTRLFHFIKMKALWWVLKCGTPHHPQVRIIFKPGSKMVEGELLQVATSGAVRSNDN